MKLSNLLIHLAVSTEPETKESAEDEDIGFFTGTKLYIVIACIAALTLVAIVQIGCTVYKMAHKSSSGSKVCTLKWLKIESSIITTHHIIKPQIYI